MIDQRISQREVYYNQKAVEIADYFADYDTKGLYNAAVEIGQEMYCRVLVLNLQGTVMTDTFTELNGTAIENAEVSKVLSGSDYFAYGAYKLSLPNKNSLIYTPNLPYKSNRSSYWTVYYANAVIHGGNKVGVLLISEPIQDLVDQIDKLSKRIILISSVVGALILVFMFFITNNMTYPIKALTTQVRAIAQGVFSNRVNIKASGEIAEFAAAFNMMTERLENLDNARNKFVSDASHELKTPLASMKLLIEALLSQPDAPRELTEEFLGDINHEIDRLTYVINDLLTIVKMDKDASLTNAVPLQLIDVLDKVVHLLQPLAQKKNITLAYTPIEDPTVIGDESKLQQAFTNLIDNAIKYSPENTMVTIRLYERGRNAVIEVEDQGIGISEEDQQHLFERFYRADKARSRETGGTGLGLAIADNVVKLHNGKITVKSELGKGSTFTVELPMQ